MLELVEKDTERVVITVFHVFTKLNRDMENIKRYQSRFGGLNIQCLKIFKKLLDGINCSLYIAEEKNSELQHIAIETIKYKIQSEIEF